MRSPHGTWELPVEEPPYAPPPAITRPPAREVAVSTRRLWAGGGAAGVGVVGVLFVRGVLNIPILSAKGGLVNQAMAVVPLSAGLAALAATALLHLLLVTTPRPVAFFGAICAIVIAIVVLQVFLAGGTMEDQVAAAMLYVVIGITVISLLAGFGTPRPLRAHRVRHARTSPAWSAVCVWYVAFSRMLASSGVLRRLAPGLPHTHRDLGQAAQPSSSAAPAMS